MNIRTHFPSHLSFGILLLSSLMASTVTAQAQSVVNPDDALGRGWTDRPWQRYEAEPGLCTTNGEFLLPPEQYSQAPLQAEASNQTALSLKEKGKAVSWTIDKPGRGVTIRFSIPDSSDGKGRKGTLQLSVSDGREPVEVMLDSFWAWQYTTIANSPEKYPDNTPSDAKFARMRFDEVRYLLAEDIPSGATLTLTKGDDDDMEYTIDFVELEPVGAPIKFEDIEAPDKVCYDGTSNPASFISANQGKTIFFPEGVVNCSRPININTDNTRIIGAGIWYTTIMFTASSDNRSTYSSRGFHTSSSNLELANMSINTINNCRYFENNPSFQVGKGLNGSWGRNSYVHDVIIEHFECGAWIQGGNNLKLERCRLRNNYADGINLAGNSANCTVTRCSFRNNGDDDMASWSTGGMANNNEFSYCTAENNWRASSLGFFGGENHYAHHIAISDGMECGARATCDFAGTGFGTSGLIRFSEISIRRCGSKAGTPGQQGGFWGSADAALNFSAGYAYDLRNILAENIDIYDSRTNAININANSGKNVSNIELKNIRIHGVGDYAYGVYIAPSVKGSGRWSNITCEGVVEPWMSDVPSGFDFEGQNSGIKGVDAADPFSNYRQNETKSIDFADKNLLFYDFSGNRILNPEKFDGFCIFYNKVSGKYHKIRL